MFTWDEDKYQENLDKHGIDFANAEKICLLHGEVVSVTHTPREDDDHIISIRKATKHEARFYFSQVPD